MRTAITGMGCVSAAGCGLEALAATLEGRRAVAPSFPEKRLNCVYASRYPVFQVPETLLNERRGGETLSFLFLRKALDEALRQARMTAETLRGLRIGVCVGTSVDASFNLFEFYRDWRKEAPVDQELFARHQSASLSDKVLQYYGIPGISQTVVTACASGTDAIGTGAEWIENGLCDVVIAGGADE
ncbi:MAG: beta-ketoacyl synthase N-terminal-like domain-containing protein, partial [Chthoniobacteraceae bacterium]|nr:beta-ketoacyl synthase N-terminal-like domain-containing protein [Chthoniobacteraceae bacterium]